MERTCSLIRDIGRYLGDEKLYKEEHIAEVFKLQPSDLFVRVLNELLLKFKRKRSHDKFLKEFYGKTNSNWKEYFHPYGIFTHPYTNPARPGLTYLVLHPVALSSAPLVSAYINSDIYCIYNQLL